MDPDLPGPEQQVIVSLRLATAEDSEFVFQTRKAAFQEYVQAAYGRWDEGRQRELHLERFPTQTFRILQVDGQEVGIMGTEVLEDCLKLNQLFILPAYHAKQIGSACIQILKSEASSAALPIKLQALKVNPRAVVFYEKHGFGVTGETDTHIQLCWNCPRNT